MTALEIARSLGGACRSGRWWRCRCPVHSSRGPTLALRDGEHGVIAYCHAGCSQGDVLIELQRHGLLGRTTAEIRRRVSPTAPGLAISTLDARRQRTPSGTLLRQPGQRR
jgi:hypothetical protein